MTDSGRLAQPDGLPFGRLGVALFFVISGFVILMALDRIRSPSDFVFARLAPGLAALAVLAIAVRGPFADAGVAIGAGLLVHGAARERLPLLASRPLVELGRVSYPLYLLHQALGWWVIVSLQQAGLGPTTSIARSTGRTRCTSGCACTCVRCARPACGSSTSSGSSARAMPATAPTPPTTCWRYMRCGPCSMHTA